MLGTIMLGINYHSCFVFAVSRVGSGYTFLELQELNNTLKKSFVPNTGEHSRPKNVLASSKGKGRPDVWVKPEHSVVVEVFENFVSPTVSFLLCLFVSLFVSFLFSVFLSFSILSSIFPSFSPSFFPFFRLFFLQSFLLSLLPSFFPISN